MKKLLPSTSSSEHSEEDPSVILGAKRRGSINFIPALVYNRMVSPSENDGACSRRMDPRGARMTAKTVLLVFAFALTFLFVACGDDDSSFAPRDDESSSSIEEESSSSSVTLSGASAESNGSSSSLAKSSSSTDAKSSSSSSLVLFESSSSLSKQLRCLLECTEDCEGETY